MESVSIDLGMKRVTNETFMEKAISYKSKRLEKEMRPVGIVSIKEDENQNVDVQRADTIENVTNIQMGKGDSICLDFGHHITGYVKIKFDSVGSPQDAPAYIRLKFGEIAKEIVEKSQDYEGWISRGWIQEEYIHIDVLPFTLELPRRYAFRFLEIYTIDTSMKWKLIVEDVCATAVSAVDMEKVERYKTADSRLQKLDEVSLRTLQNCMHDVFEDGPKRDRRLWLGDLRLQAKTNYATFKNYDLVKRCLYLFAGQTRDDGRISACLFIEPKYIIDDTFFFDYSLFFVSVLYDYYQETKDMDTLIELWPSALRQIELARLFINEKNLIVLETEFECFVDWKSGLDKNASAQGIYIYCLRQAIYIAKQIGENRMEYALSKEMEMMIESAVKEYWDDDQGLFISGKKKQISYASQVWMILAEVVSKERGATILKNLIQRKPEMGMVTPYMNHHFTESLILCGMKKEALEYMEYYWGGMLEQGADTFWELYNPIEPKESPYGSSIVNSYCHAWSCTPTYLLRTYF